MGPVIEAIDAGHVKHAEENGIGAERCLACNVFYPCRTILKARREQLVYADRLKHKDFKSMEVATP